MMSPGDANPTVFISAAEQSADEHAAALIRAFLDKRPHARFAGLAGPAMRAQGCECFHDMTAGSAMALAAIRRIPEALRLLRRVKEYLAENTFAAAVVVDSPTLNLPIAKLCRARGIPVMYYIAPQTWAWASWRNARVRRRVNRLACIWPFEEQWFRDAGIPATYVGHPSFDHLLALEIDEDRIRALRGAASPVVTLLPGSRKHVVEEVLPGQLEVAKSLTLRFKRAHFLVVPANEQMRVLIEKAVSEGPWGLSVEVLSGPDDRAAAIRAADLALVASGTITLEVAYHATPMIVMYNANRWMYRLLGRWLIATKHLSIPNILAGRQVVPEFMPYYASTTPIAAVAAEWLSTPATLARVRADLRDVIQPIVKTGAADNAAAELAELLDETWRAKPGE
ncbi:MAG: lipid-A-disaccharide synthase [Planctomycetota bacterium]